MSSISIFILHKNEIHNIEYKSKLFILDFVLISIYGFFVKYEKLGHIGDQEFDL